MTCCLRSVLTWRGISLNHLSPCGCREHIKFFNFVGKKLNSKFSLSYLVQHIQMSTNKPSIISVVLEIPPLILRKSDQFWTFYTKVVASMRSINEKITSLSCAFQPRLSSTSVMSMRVLTPVSFPRQGLEWYWPGHCSSGLCSSELSFVDVSFVSEQMTWIS